MIRHHHHSAPHAPSSRSQAPRQQRSEDKDTVVFGQYNVKNMFDSVDQDPKLGTAEKPAREMEALARNIMKSGADVVTLQEVENKEVLQGFLDKYMPGQFKNVVLIEGNDHRGIDVAVISKYDVTNVVSHKDNHFPSSTGTDMQYNRDLLRVDIDVKGHPFSVFTSHFKSKRGGEWSEQERIGEARETRRILGDEMGDWSKKNFVVQGDLNDTPGSKTIETVRHGADGKGPELLSSLDHLPLQERNTWPAKGPKEQIDFILYPEHMDDAMIGTRVWRDKNASDHCMVTAEFKLDRVA